jgi:hypothetical protein
MDMTRCLLLNLPHQPTISATTAAATTTATVRTMALASALAVDHLPLLVQDP